jgi:hypothetical protein
MGRRSDADDEIDEAFAGSPVVADADRCRVEVRVEDGGKNFAFGTLARVVQGQLDFHKVLVARDRLASWAACQSLHAVGNLVQIRRIPSDGLNLNTWKVLEGPAHLFGISQQSSVSW